MLKPGGYLQCIEANLEGTLSHDLTLSTTFRSWQDKCVEMNKSLGMRTNPNVDLVSDLRRWGYDECLQRPFMVPAGASPYATERERRIAAWMTEATTLTLASLRRLPVFTGFIAMDDEELDLFVSEVRREIMDPAHVWSSQWLAVAARKPS